jgi:hypothetical protein
MNILDKRTYFLKALNAEAFLYKQWILQMFAVFKPDNRNFDEREQYPYMILSGVRSREGYWSFLDPVDTNGGIIAGSGHDKPIFDLHEKIKLKKGELPNVDRDLETTYGNVLVNMMVLCWPFGGKIPFITGQIKAGQLDSLVAAMLEDYPEGDAPRKPDRIYVDELLKYTDAMSALGGLAQLCAPAASPKTMTVDPSVLKRRDELIREAGETIHDPAVLAKIETELIAMDRATFEGDPALKFFVKAKTFNVARKKMHIMHGAELGFGDSTKKLPVITTPLVDGIDISQMPALADSLRAGSYNRGAETALGGESVKYFYRIFQNSKVVEDDCGVKEGLSWTVTKDNASMFIGQYQIKAGQSVAMSPDDVQKLIGSKISVRSPMLCKSVAPSFCAKCVGDILARAPTGLHIAASDVGSAFMASSMAAMHGKALTTARYQPSIVIS